MVTTSENWEKRYRETNKNQNRQDPVFNPSVKKGKVEPVIDKTPKN